MTRISRLACTVLLAVALANSGCTMWGEKKTNSWKTVTAGEELTRLFWTEIKQKNWSELNSHISSTVIAINSRGAYNREGVLEHVKKMNISEFQVGDVRTEPAGESLVVTYTLAVRGTIDGQPLPATVRFLSVWQQVKSGWLLVAHSAVPAS